jgi:hypothetical protein
MKFNMLGMIVLSKDIPEKKLTAGDLGVIVEMYTSTDMEVEFITGDGHTQALLPLNSSDIRLVSGSDILSVRSLDVAA